MSTVGTIEIKLAGLQFKVRYEKATYAVLDVQRLDAGDWVDLSLRQQAYMLAYLPREVIMWKEGITS